MKAAEDWLKAAADELRAARLRRSRKPAGDLGPPAAEPNVSLGGSSSRQGTQSGRTFDVTVDGVEGAALGVMSQGELHALALCLFLPRATLAESPFRFIVIDDPVQSMDPARVDGLARVLARRGRIASGRRLHARRPAAGGGSASRLAATSSRSRGAPARWSSVRRALDPSSGYLDDARTLVADTELPETRRAADRARLLPQRAGGGLR